MSNNHKNTAIGRIFALAVLIAGTCSVAATTWATTCFLPSGNCSTGRVGNDGDGGGSGGGEEPEDTCKDFGGNTTKSEYDWKSTTSCFKCDTCTNNGNTQYKCEADSEYKWWGNGKDGHCCLVYEKWYPKANGGKGDCCRSSGCTCPPLQKWSNDECVCQYEKTSNGTCCEKSKTADKHLCCNAGEHAETTICCPANKHEEGGTCVCDANYENDGTGCKPIDKCKDYDLTASQAAQYNTNCYTCSNCDSKYKCEVRTTPLNGYTLNNGVCSCTPKDCSGHTLSGSDLSNTLNTESCTPGCGQATKYKCKVGYYYDSKSKSCQKLELVKTTITINFVDTKGAISLGSVDSDADDYYYRKVKFYTTSSDSQSHKVTMKTYPGATCLKTDYVVGSTVSVTEGSETVYESKCGYANTKILAVSTAKVETYVGNTLVDSVEPKVEGMGSFHSALSNRTHESNGYIIKYVEGFTCKQKGYQTKADCSGDETFTPASGIKDADGSTQCGTCKPKGFTIYADDQAVGYYKCYKNGTYTDVSMRLYLKSGIREAKDINGNTVEKITTKGVTYPAGTYQVCLYRSQPGIVYIISLSITENGSRFKCWDFPYNGSAVNDGCETSQEGVKQTSCYTATFKAGKEYTINQGWIGSGSNDQDTWKCPFMPSLE